MLKENVIIDDFEYEQFKDGNDKYKSWFFDEVVTNCYGIMVGCNDTFAYAVGDAEMIYTDDLWDLDPLIQKFKGDAINAYLALRRGEDVLKPLQTIEYLKCKKIIKELKDNHGLFTWFKYGQGALRKY